MVLVAATKCPDALFLALIINLSRLCRSTTDLHSWSTERTDMLRSPVYISGGEARDCSTERDISSETGPPERGVLVREEFTSSSCGM